MVDLIDTTTTGTVLTMHFETDTGGHRRSRLSRTGCRPRIRFCGGPSAAMGPAYPRLKPAAP